MNMLNYCDVQSYSGPDWSTSLFDTLNGVTNQDLNMTACHNNLTRSYIFYIIT